MDAEQESNWLAQNSGGYMLAASLSPGGCVVWIESHQSLKDHPKTKRVARALDVPVPYVMGMLHCLWYWAMDYAQDGDLTGYSDEDIADAAEYTAGDASAFVEALVTCGTKGGSGFIDRSEDGGLFLHDWWEYAGKLIDSRKRNKALYSDMTLTRAVKARDGNKCRYCGKAVDWQDHKSGNGGSYDHIDPDGPNAVANVVVACKSCIAAKARRTPEAARMPLLPPAIVPPDTRHKSTINPHTVPNLTVPNQPDQPDLRASTTANSALAAQSTRVEPPRPLVDNPPNGKLGHDAEPAEPEPPPTAPAPSAFDLFWSAFPSQLKDSRELAAREFARQVNRAPPESIAAAAVEFAERFRAGAVSGEARKRKATQWLRSAMYDAYTPSKCKAGAP